MTPTEYRAKGMLHLERAQADTNENLKNENLRLALSYLRLADMADKNIRNDLIYEPPPLTAPSSMPQPEHQHQQQQQQQPQQQTQPDKE